MIPLTSVQRPERSQTLPLLFLCTSTRLLHYYSMMYHFIELISHRHVIVKLLAFTLAMVVGPIGTYFLTLNTLYKGRLAVLDGTCDLVLR